MADYRTSDPQTTPRGIRNNNPGNIAIGDSWQGMVGNDGTFIIFADTTWGVRAIARSLTTMIGKGYNTIQTLIPQWSATDQAAYIANVSAYTGIPVNQLLETDQTTLHDLIRAIIDQEDTEALSDQYISDADIDAGISMAGNAAASLPAAAVVYAQANPIEASAMLLVAVWLISQLFEES
jgi:hypothetical protein